MKQRKPVVLTKQQKECVTYPADQPLLIRGIPGSGKTTVLLERAQYLQQHGEQVSQGPKVIFLTYNGMLARYVAQMEMEAGQSRVQAMTFHGWGMQLLGDTGLRFQGDMLMGDKKLDLVRYARNTIAKYRPHLKAPHMPQAESKGKSTNSTAVMYAEAEFLADEFEWIKGLDKDRDRYMSEPRTGRGTGIQVQKEHREWVWACYEKYEEMRTRRGQFDYDDVARLLLRLKDKISRDRRPSHILVDEAQDLTVAQLKAIAALGLRSITVAADKGQSIYNRTFSWAEIGINIRGRSRSLEQTYRSTRQIVQLARSLQRFDPLVIRKDEEFVPPQDPDIDGPLPELCIAPNLASQVAQVADWVAGRCKAFPEDTVGVTVPSKLMREKFEEALRARGVPVVVLQSREPADILGPGAKLVTFHSAKGLEFDHVAVTSLKDGLVPANAPKEASREDQEEFRSTERRKVFVAITRAKLSVALFGVMPCQFVMELGSGLYVRKS